MRCGAAGLFLCIAGALGPGLQAQERLGATVDSIARAAIESGRAAGMTVAVVRGDEPLHVGAYGYADLELQVPTPERAVYEIGSVTKQFTAVALLMLAEEGRLSLDDDLTDWLPDYPLGPRRVTLERLLDHTSGIKGYTEMDGFRGLAVQDLPQDSLVALFAAEPFDFEPGDALIYNNSAYFLLGRIIEKASGATYEEFVERRLFEPAGMEDSRYCHKDELTPRRAKGYQAGPEGALRPADYLNHLWPYSAGSLCSTATDLIAWNEALHGDGEGGDLLSPASYAALVTPGALNDGTSVRYAKGLAITDRDGSRRIAHGGGIFGYLSDLRYFPEQDLSIAVLVNTAGPVSPSRIATAIENAVLGPVAPVVGRTYAGDLSRFEGRYRGPSRGATLTVTVGRDENGLTVRRRAGETESVRWLGGTTFARGDTRYRFLMDGDRPVALQVDDVASLYVLERR